MTDDETNRPLQRRIDPALVGVDPALVEDAVNFWMVHVAHATWMGCAGEETAPDAIYYALIKEFSSLSSEQFAAICAIASERSLEIGRNVFRPGHRLHLKG